MRLLCWHLRKSDTTARMMNANQIRRLIATGCHETFEADHLRGLSATINGADFPEWEKDAYQEDIRLRIKRIEAIQNQKINDLIQNA